MHRCILLLNRRAATGAQQLLQQATSLALCVYFSYLLPGRLKVHALVSMISMSSRKVPSEYVGSVS
jgi:hypothetical protein